MTFVVAMYDIASDQRRIRVADILAESGARMQLSVFETRLYRFPGTRPERIVLGNRVLDEREPYLAL